MMKAIRFQDVRPGDVVCAKEDEHLVVQRIERYTQPDSIVLRTKGARLHLLGELGAIIGLIHRPQSSASQSNEFLDIMGACRSFLSLYDGRPVHDSPEYFKERDEKLMALREAIEAYELGKPLEPTEEDCLADICGHPRNFGGCLIWQMKHPFSRECRK